MKPHNATATTRQPSAGRSLIHGMLLGFLLAMFAMQMSMSKLPVPETVEPRVIPTTVVASKTGPKERIVPNPIIPLDILARTADAPSLQCKSPLVRVDDILQSPQAAQTDRETRKIPRIVHLSSKSRCNHEKFAENMKNWQLEDHAFFLHDDDAVERLMYKDWPEFPQLSQVLKCMPANKGAIMVDIWRLLVLWEYGGIYADMDTAPVPHKFNATTITAEDDAFFVIEILGSPSQWFMAASPKHPMMYMAIQLVMKNLANYEGGYFRVIWTTGPGVVAEAFRLFHGTDMQTYKVKPGVHFGVDGRSATIVGSKEDQNEYITRVVSFVHTNEGKNKIYEDTGMKHLTQMNHSLTTQPCMEQMYESVSTSPWSEQEYFRAVAKANGR